MPFEIANEPPEPTETIPLSKLRRDATKTADTICRFKRESIKNNVFKSRNLM